MDIALVQIAALVANGNAWLAGDGDAAARVEHGSTFRLVQAVRFERQVEQAPTHVAGDVATWFRQCAELRVTALWMEPRPLAAPVLPPHLAAAWANGSKSSIVTEGPDPRERWIANWSLGRVPTKTDKRAWLVNVVGRPDVANLAARRSVAEVSADLQATVREARDLGRTWGIDFWAGVLDDALGQAASDDPRTSYHNDVLPPTAELDQRRLFALAVRAFVFGGMGSWNDSGPPDAADVPTYDRVTETLYARVLEGVATAVNPRPG